MTDRESILRQRLTEVQEALDEQKSQNAKLLELRKKSYRPNLSKTRTIYDYDEIGEDVVELLESGSSCTLQHIRKIVNRHSTHMPLSPQDQYPCPLCDKTLMKVRTHGDKYQVYCMGCNFTVPEEYSNADTAFMGFISWLWRQGYLDDSKI